MTWKHTIDTGKVCVRMKAAKGGGLVTAFMVDSFLPGQEIDDELDVSLAGGTKMLDQSNLFLPLSFRWKLSAVTSTTGKATISRKTTATIAPPAFTRRRVIRTPSTVSMMVLCRRRTGQRCLRVAQ